MQVRSKSAYLLKQRYVELREWAHCISNMAFLQCFVRSSQLSNNNTKAKTPRLFIKYAMATDTNSKVARC